MRTTVTLEPDTEALVRQLMQERHLSFKDAVNEAIRSGLRAPRAVRKYRTPTFALGSPEVPLTKALEVAAALEDDELIRKMALGK